MEVSKYLYNTKDKHADAITQQSSIESTLARAVAVPVGPRHRSQSDTFVGPTSVLIQHRRIGIEVPQRNDQIDGEDDTAGCHGHHAGDSDQVELEDQRRSTVAVLGLYRCVSCRSMPGQSPQRVIRRYSCYTAAKYETSVHDQLVVSGQRLLIFSETSRQWEHACHI